MRLENIELDSSHHNAYLFAIWPARSFFQVMRMPRFFEPCIAIRMGQLRVADSSMTAIFVSRHVIDRQRLHVNSRLTDLAPNRRLNCITQKCSAFDVF
jgi:hypothetical protein